MVCLRFFSFKVHQISDLYCYAYANLANLRYLLRVSDLLFIKNRCRFNFFSRYPKRKLLASIECSEVCQ